MCFPCSAPRHPTPALLSSCAAVPGGVSGPGHRHRTRNRAMLARAAVLPDPQARDAGSQGGRGPAAVAQPRSLPRARPQPSRCGGAGQRRCLVCACCGGAAAEAGGAPRAPADGEPCCAWRPDQLCSLALLCPSMAFPHSLHCGGAVPHIHPPLLLITMPPPMASRLQDNADQSRYSSRSPSPVMRPMVAQTQQSGGSLWVSLAASLCLARTAMGSQAANWALQLAPPAACLRPPQRAVPALLRRREWRLRASPWWASPPASTLQGATSCRPPPSRPPSSSPRRPRWASKAPGPRFRRCALRLRDEEFIAAAALLLFCRPLTPVCSGRSVPVPPGRRSEAGRQA